MRLVDMGVGTLYRDCTKAEKPYKAQKIFGHHLWSSARALHCMLYAFCFHACTSQHWPCIPIPAMVAATCHAENILVSSLGGLIVIALYTIL